MLDRRSLFVIERSARNRKLALVQQLLSTPTILVIQKVRGTEALFKEFCSWIAFRYLAFFSLPSAEAGGLVTLVPRLGSGVLASRFSFSDPVPGRASRLEFSVSSVSLVVWNLHNHGLLASEAKVVAAMIREDFGNARAAPLLKFALAFGDLNAEQPTTPRFYPEDPSRCDLAAAPSGPTKTLLDVLAVGIEIVPDFFSHFSARFGFASLIDRCFVASPPWVLGLLAVNPFQAADPISLSHGGISDHAPWEFLMRAFSMLFLTYNIP